MHRETSDSVPSARHANRCVGGTCERVCVGGSSPTIGRRLLSNVRDLNTTVRGRGIRSIKDDDPPMRCDREGGETAAATGSDSDQRGDAGCDGRLRRREKNPVLAQCNASQVLVAIRHASVC